MTHLTVLLVLTVLGVQSTRAQESLGCAAGWTLSGKNCYKLFSEKMEWFDASDVCKSYGAHLVSIFGYQENKEAGEFVRSQGVDAFWIGMPEGDNPDRMGFWSGAEPKEGRECAYVGYGADEYYKYAWSKARCNAAMPFLCERNAILEGMYSCLNGNFIKPSDVCDGQNGCGDDSDERDCDNLCRRYLKRLEGTIQTENPYGPNQHCQWSIEAPVGSRLMLDFSSVRTEENHDEIQVWVGGPTLATSTLKARISGNKNVDELERIYSRNNFMIIVFTSDSSVSMSGFVAEYQTEDILPGSPTLLQAPVESPAYIESPMYNERVLSSQRITYNLFVPLDRRVISVQVVDIDLPMDAYVEFYDGSSLESPILARIQGGDAMYTQSVISTGNNMTVYYHSGSHDYAMRGVRLSYREGCSGMIQGDSGVLISPGYDAEQDYPNFQECSWNIQAQTTLPLKFIIDDEFQLSGTLGDDMLKIYEGEDDSGSLLSEAIGDETPTAMEFTASTGKVFVSFKTTSINNAKGFKIKFSKNCPEPDFPDNAIVTPTSYTTELDSELTVQCPPGYFFAQEQHVEKNLVKLQCLPGGWNVDSVPICEPVYCGQPPVVSFAHVLESEGVQYEDKVTYECDPGFGFSGNDFVTCTGSGTWTSAPVCTAASCPQQSAPAFGSMSVIDGSGTDYSSIVEFECDKGFQINGDPIIDCLRDGTWSAERPTCERLECTFPVIPNAEPFADESIPFGSSATVSCMQGFELDGEARITCQDDQSFDNIPNCNDIVECAGDQSGPCDQICRNTIGGFECSCQPGYEPTSDTSCGDIDECSDGKDGGCSHGCSNSVGSYICTCPAGTSLFTADGVEGFTNTAPETGERFGDKYYIDHTCVPKKCPDLAVLENGRILSQEETFHYEDEVHFFCDLGYQISNTAPLVCQSNGEWNLAQPTCEVAQCPFPSTSGFSFAPAFSPQSGPISYGEELTLTCSQFRPTALVRTRQCVYDQENDIYTVALDDTLDCPVIDCGEVDLSIVPASVITSTPQNNYYGAQFTIGCGTQSTVLETTGNPEGEDQVVCREDGNWDFGRFRCLAKQCEDPGTPAGARQVAEGYSEGQEVTFECLREGFTLTFDDPLICQLDGASAVWNRGLPECVDTTDPVISQAQNLCGETMVINKLSAPINSAAGFTLPTATDNTGASKSLSLQASPPFNPQAILGSDFSTVFTATDFEGNTDTCAVSVEIRDETFPTLNCPDSYTVQLFAEGTRTILFPEAGRAATASDNEGEPTVTYQPNQLVVNENNVGELYRINVEATDASNNKRQCAFTVNVEAGPCQDWAIAAPRGGIKTCRRNDQDNGYECVMTCTSRHYFYDDPVTPSRTYTCIDGSAFVPAGNVPDCVRAEDSEYLSATNVVYTYSGNLEITQACNDYYKEEIADRLPAAATRARGQCQLFLEDIADEVDVQPVTDREDYFDILFNTAINEVTVTVTFSLFPRNLTSATLENSCGVLITAAFFSGFFFSATNLGTIPAKPDDVNCPALVGKLNTATSNSNLNGRVCSEGYKREDLPTGSNICVPCPYGYYYNPNIDDTSSAAFCQPCPVGQYSDTSPVQECTECPGETYTKDVGSPSQSFCLDTCLNVGMKSNSRLAPCEQCATGSYTIDAATCQTCPVGTNTDGPGGRTENDCKDRCPLGQWSDTGLAPCLQCPEGFYQDEIGRTTCKECATNLVTDQGADSSADCSNGQSRCVDNFCNGHGTCSINQHMPRCDCDSGYRGLNCEEEINYCESSPCYSGTCVREVNGYTCNCPSADFSGDRCENDPDNCIDHQCVNGGQCQDLIDRYECLCPSNYAGTFCDISEDICTVQPCENSGQCERIDSTRRKCVCPDGFTGRNCENNIDECSSNPCLYGAECQDGANRFTCLCDTGFGGTRCEFPPDICALNPCSSSGDCFVDYLNNYYVCLCNQGYEADSTRAVEEDLWMKDIPTMTVERQCPRTDFCVTDPCERGTCNSLLSGADCTCPTGFEGHICQHDKNDCASDPCGDHGTCVDGTNVYTCRCDDGYTGTNCDIEKNECTSPSYPCASAGTDTSQGRYSGCDDLVNGYRCYCNPGYTGDDCSVNINECASNPCLHQGECVDEANRFECNCPDGWTGARCELYEEYCDTNPCQNNAECLNAFGKPLCKCSDRRYYGELCELETSVCENPDPCIDEDAICYENEAGEAECDCSVSGRFTGTGCHIAIDFCGQEGICQHGGTCQPKLNDYECECTTDFFGKNCEQSQNDCVNVICQNGGQCVDGVNTHFCECPIGKTGRNCDKDVDDDFDIAFFSEDNTATACTSYPFSLGVNSFSIGLWVRFSERRGEGTFLTLFGSDERYVGSRMREILRIDHDKVYLTFGFISEAFRFTLYDINDGQWYHINIQWSGETGTASVMVNSVRVIHIPSGHGEGWTMPDFGMIVLGAQVDASMEPIPGTGFNGVVSKVNLWNRVLSFTTEIPSMADDYQALVLPGLIRRWTDYLVKFGATVIRKSQANSVVCEDERFTGPACNVPVPDKTPPKILNCPDTVWAYNENRLTQIEWEDVEVEGADEPGASVRSTYLNERVFTWGKYINLIVAQDASGNAALCSFDIFVRKTDCPEPVPAPQDGSAVCSSDSWPFRTCDANCNQGKTFSVPVPNFYTCGPQGAFNTENFNLGFSYPACAQTIRARVNVNVYITYEQIPACEEVKKVEGFAIPILEYIRTLNDLWGENRGETDGFCHGEPCEDVVTVKSECSGANTVGRRRRATGDAFITVTMEGIREYLFDKNEERQTPKDILLSFILDDGGFDLSESVPNAVPNEPALRIQMSPICGEGQTVAESGLDCVDCAPGTYYNSGTGTCVQCAQGTYQDESKAMFCKSCGSGKTTELVGTISSAECYDSCDTGAYLNKGTGVCQWCEIGFYQDEPGQFYCKPCDADKTTRGTNSKSKSECLDVCPDGTDLTTTGGCTVCQRGTYRTQGVHSRCQQCPAGFITPTTRARTVEECTIPDCPAGSFHNVDENRCDICTFGLYQPQKWQESCINCPDRKTTLQEGSTSSEQCLFFCPKGLEEFPEGSSTCRLCPLGTFKDNADPGESCTSCEDVGRAGFVTEGPGSTSASNCTVLACIAGQQPNENADGCDPCPLGTYQPSPYQLECIACEPGKSTREEGAIVSSECESFCEEGYYHDAFRNCIPCEIGTYRNNNGNKFGPCELCPPQFITATEASTLPDDCRVSNCTAGSYLNAGPNICVDCSMGTYQDEWWQTECKDCPSQKTTEGTGSDSETDCLLNCDPGFEDAADMLDECVECSIGYYKSSSGSTLCDKCPEGFITANIGATSSGQCSIGDCQPGTFRDTADDRCYDCGRGFYQDRKWQTECIQCPIGSNGQYMTTAGQGADERSDCFLLCDSGSEFSEVLQRCTECPLGTYRTVNVQDFCTLCPLDFITSTTAAVTQAQCNVANCSAGTYLNENDNTCEPCPRGEYQPMKWQTQCRQCPIGTTTLQEGGASQSACVRSCPAGQELNVGTNQCRPCPQNQYRNPVESFECLPCPDGTIAPSQGATSREQCAWPDCPEGYFIRNGQCEQCEDGTYQPDKWKTSCLLCPGSPSVTTNGLGATSIQACQSTNDCELIDDLCLGVGEICFDLPELNQYECRCQGKYVARIGATAPCVHKCDTEYCLNNATCDRNQPASRLCNCVNGWTGERCNEEPPSMTPYIIGGAVGGFIFILIVALIVTACCVCLRPSPAAPAAASTMKAQSMMMMNPVPQGMVARPAPSVLYAPASGLQPTVISADQQSLPGYSNMGGQQYLFYEDTQDPVVSQQQQYGTLNGGFDPFEEKASSLAFNPNSSTLPDGTALARSNGGFAAEPSLVYGS